jgi:hypothetical protein
MASPTIDKLFALMVPKKAPKAGIASSPTYNPAANTQVLALPGYHDHLQTFYDNRTTYDTRTLLKQMFKQDPDVSAAVGAYLTMADTTPVLLHYDLQGQIDPAGTATLNQLVSALTKQVDYTQGFSFKTNLAMLCQELRYMVMLRGGVAGELVLDKNYVPVRIQQVDLSKRTLGSTSPSSVRRVCPSSSNWIFRASSSPSTAATPPRSTRSRISCRRSTPSPRASKSSTNSTA